MEVQTIWVGHVATLIPPGAFIVLGTVTSAVIITIFGGEWISSVITKGISSGTFKKVNNYTINYSVPFFSCEVDVRLKI